MKLLRTFFYKPLTSTLTVTSTNGFHLRPAAKFATEAKQFTCDIHIEFSDKRINAKAVNAILSLNLDTDDTFTLIAHGKDAKKALSLLNQTFAILMNAEHAPKQVEKLNASYQSPTQPGEIISEGIAVGKLHHFVLKEVQHASLSSFKQAVENSVVELDKLYNNSKKNADAHIYLAQKALLLSLAEEVDTLEGFNSRIEAEKEILRGGRHATKIADLNDLLYRIKKQMGYDYQVSLPKTPFILTADDLLPSQIKVLEHSTVLGVALANSSLASHTAILLRAAGIPSLLLDKPLKHEEDKVILDAYSGLIVLKPSPEDLIQAFKRQNEDDKLHSEIHQNRFNPAITQKGEKINIFANVSDLDSAKEAKEEGAEGIGLLRSEFLFKEHKPIIRDQIRAYRAIFDLFEDVTVRTLDVGGDKALPYIDIPKEQNPFLGIRGIRLLKTDPKLLEEQLEAILIAADNRPVKVMFPMISTPEEFKEAKDFALNIAREKDIPIDNVRFGMMIEVPSVLFALQEFNTLVDFYSIGTNDLAQYLFAIERTHPTLKIDPHSPILFNVIERIVKEATKPVSICGELAGDTRVIPQLLKTGVQTLSVSSKRIGQIKDKVRNV
ncbi:HPr family phosphocarrier protein [Sulfurovum sp. zt1-1]|uniref:HPr family phosphocarrier protein n=1 Tax=Sulfurovum zhangzhouensis TaxID=3019067 RepID=A0ABT7QXD9_9BACT|nr:HPr family phosphocarrier protein [Sulfurovum zhangzhouensis]MDM5271500.1 HPr family phosphocarrier protein [Sulfurovum zhangzhouensis]